MPVLFLYRGTAVPLTRSTHVSMNILSDMKTTGLLAFLRVDGGRELDLDFKAKSFSIPITVTLDGHVVKAFLSLVPTLQKVGESGPNMELVITRERVVLATDGSLRPESYASEGMAKAAAPVALAPEAVAGMVDELVAAAKTAPSAPVVEVKAEVKAEVKTEAPPAPVVEVKADSKPAAKAEDKKQK